jgi:hypothetical protein
VAHLVLIQVAERSEARVCGRSLAGIARSNPVGAMDACIVQKGQKAKPGQSGQSSTDKVQKENKKKWLRHFAVRRNVAGSIPDRVIGIFFFFVDLILLAAFIGLG